jgi:hypothetical protein
MLPSIISHADLRSRRPNAGGKRLSLIRAHDTPWTGGREKGAGPERPAPFSSLTMLNGLPVPRAPLRSAGNTPRGAFPFAQTRPLRTGPVARYTGTPRRSPILVRWLGTRVGELPHAARRLVVVDTTARHPMLLAASIWSTAPPGFGSSRVPPLARPAHERSGQETPVRISYLPRELVITIR